jgi:hypothetical protein
MANMSSIGSPLMLSRSLDPRRGVEPYLAPGEHVIYASRRNMVVLDYAIGVWISALVLGLAVGFASRDHPSWYLGQIGIVIFLTGTALLGWRAWEWWIARYVFTNHRVLLIEGIVNRRVSGLPLRVVLDTTYHRSLWGRVRGYGDLELNVSGQPGLRKLTSLSQPASMYQLILSLINENAQCPANMRDSQADFLLLQQF